MDGSPHSRIPTRKGSDSSSSERLTHIGDSLQETGVKSKMSATGFSMDWTLYIFFLLLSYVAN